MRDGPGFALAGSLPKRAAPVRHPRALVNPDASPMEHACRDRGKRRCAIWLFPRARLFANARCKMRDALDPDRIGEPPFIHGLFGHTRGRAGQAARGPAEAESDPFPYAPNAAVRA